MEAERQGETALPPAGDDVGLADALDCDLGLSPLTNSMPVLRHGLLDGGGPIDLTMAWVSVPELIVSRSAQRYSFIRRDDDLSVVRFEDDSGFSADIVFDSDGLIVNYPGIARRLDCWSDRGIFTRGSARGGAGPWPVWRR